MQPRDSHKALLTGGILASLERARRLIPQFEGELVPACRHDMRASQHHIVDARVLDFLKTTRTDDRAQTADRSVAVLA